MRKRPFIVGAAVMAAAALALSACGGDDDADLGDGAATVTEAVDSVADAATDEVADATETTDAADPSTDASSASEPITVQLEEQNGSGVSGSATITPGEGGMSTVTIELTGSPGGAQPAHIHTGSCAELGDVLVPLEDVADTGDTGTATSETTVETPPASDDYAINVHESAEAIDNYVACGDVQLGSG